MPASCIDMRQRLRKTVSQPSVSADKEKPNTYSADFLSKSFRTEVVSTSRKTLIAKKNPRGGVSAQRRAHAFDGVRVTAKARQHKYAHRQKTSNIFEFVVLRYRRAVQSRPVALRAFMVGSMLFGAVSATLTYRYLGEKASAQESVVVVENPNKAEVPQVLGVTDTAPEDGEDELTDTVMNDFADVESEEQMAFETKLRDMVEGYPIEDMVPFIATKDRVIAAFLIGIAKKESAWGKRVPLYKGHDCFNYWGYRGRRRFMGTGGHTCFNSPEDAVNTVARRIEKLVYNEKRDTPAEMMTAWKCGYDCSGHSKADTRKWISDVEMYFREVDEEG